MMARNKNVHSQSSSNLKKSHSKSMAIEIADSAIIDLVQPPLMLRYLIADLSHLSPLEQAQASNSHLVQTNMNMHAAQPGGLDKCKTRKWPASELQEGP